MLHGGREKFVQRAKAAAGKNQFPAHLRVAPAHEAQQFDLQFGVRRKIGVAAFGGHDAGSGFSRPRPKFACPSPVPAAISAAGAAVFVLARIENAEIFRREMFDAVARGAQIVQSTTTCLTFNASTRLSVSTVQGRFVART